VIDINCFLDSKIQIVTYRVSVFHISSPDISPPFQAGVIKD